MGKSFYFLISLLVVLGILTYFFFNPSPIELADPVSEDAQKAHAEKLAEYDAFLTSQQDEINELDAESDRLKQRDRELDAEIQQLDKELGLTPEEFNKKYPGFDMNGVYQ